jgi:integrase
MGKIRVRDETRCLFFDFRIEGKRCREQTTLKDTPANRRKMQKMLVKIEREIVTGDFDYGKYFPGSRNAIASSYNNIVVLHQPHKQKAGVLREIVNVVNDEEIDSPLFQDFAETWFGENEVTWRQNTQKMHRCHLRRHILPPFGCLKVHEISKADLLGFRADLGKIETRSKRGSLAPKTINEIMNTVLSILSEAADRFEYSDPGQKIKRLKIQKNHIEPLSLDNVQKFLSIIRSDYKDYFTVRFFTGMRTGEVHGLKWKNIDFERREILVRETYSAGMTEYTKNDGSQREIKMSEIVFNALQSQHKSTGSLSEYVFCTKTAKPIDAMNINKRIWKPTLRLIGLEERRLYQTRHTAATLWLGAGENPEWIARQMGHTSTEMLFRVYSRYVPNLTHQDGSAFDRLLETQFNSTAQRQTLRVVGSETKEVLKQK